MPDVKVDRCACGILLLAGLVTLGGLTALAEETASSPEAQKPDSQPAKVYTNRDLPREPQPDARTYTNEDLPRQEPESEAAGPAERVFTNEDLARLSPEPVTPLPPAPETELAEPAIEPSTGDDTDEKTSGEFVPPPPPARSVDDDPLAQLEAEARAGEVREQVIEQAEASLAAAREKVKQLEVQLLAVSNPFSARPQLSEEEKQARATSGETAIERRARTEELVEEAKREVASLELRIQELRRQ